MKVFIRPTGAALGQTLGFAPNGSAASLDTAPLHELVLPGDYALIQSGGQLAKVPASAIGGGAGSDVSNASVTIAPGTTPRSVKARFADVVNVLDFGADPTGAADSAPAFAAAIASVPSGQQVRLWVPRGSYKLGSVVGQAGRIVAVEFDDGADIAPGSPGYLGVARVEARQGAKSVLVTNGGYFGFAIASAQGTTLNGRVITNNEKLAANAWNWSYTNLNSYSNAGNTQDQVWQRVASAPQLFDASAWLDWANLNGPIYDEASRDNLGLAGSLQIAEWDVINNAPDVGWTDIDAIGTPATGLAVDPAGALPPYLGGHIRYAFGTAGGVTGGYAGRGALNERWWTYPAVFSMVNPAASGTGAQLTITATDGAGTNHGPVTVTVGGSGALADWASAINAAAIPGVGAAVSTWGGSLSRLVIYSTVPHGLGTLTLGGDALSGLGISGGTYLTPRAQYIVAFGHAGITGAAGITFTLNGQSITVGGAGDTRAVADAICAANIIGIKGDVNIGGRLVITAWCGSQQLAAPYWTGQVFPSLAIAGLSALGIPDGTYYAATPPLAFATAWTETNPPSVPAGSVISIDGIQVPLSGSLSAIASAINAAAIPNVSAILRPGGVQMAIRRTDGGALTLQDVTGKALDLLGIAPAGVPATFQPGGYSAGSYNTFCAEPDATAPQGRSVYAGGSSYSDISVWPHAPFEARGNFHHGLRLDKAAFASGVALRVASDHTIAFGGPDAQHQLGVSGGAPQFDGSQIPTLASFSAFMSAWLASLPTVPGPPGAWWNNNGTPVMRMS